jgi:hypothetical protein
MLNVRSNTRRKYAAAMYTAAGAGVRFTSDRPQGRIVYAALLLLGFKWSAQTQEWTRWHQPFIVVGREAS